MMTTISKKPLTRRQSEILLFVQSGGRVHADYTGGPADDLENWDFTAWIDGPPPRIDSCPFAARSLLQMGLVKILEPNKLGYRFLARKDDETTA
jgi:hypothetical protein